MIQIEPTTHYMIAVQLEKLAPPFDHFGVIDGARAIYLLMDGNSSVLNNA